MSLINLGFVEICMFVFRNLVTLSCGWQLLEISAVLQKGLATSVFFQWNL